MSVENVFRVDGIDFFRRTITGGLVGIGLLREAEADCRYEQAYDESNPEHGLSFISCGGFAVGRRLLFMKRPTGTTIFWR